MNASDVLTTGIERGPLQIHGRVRPSGHPAILSLATASPRGRFTQREIYDALSSRWVSYRHPRIEQIFGESDIDHRCLCLDIGDFTGDETIDEMHRRFVDGATGMGCDAIRSALAGSGVGPHEIDCIVVATCTGYVCPGLSAVYAREFGFPKRLQRADLVGMGCAGALPAMQRACDYVTAHPGGKALVVAVEVCSACYYLDDSLETIIGNAICADGAAAMVVGTRDDEPGGRSRGDEADLLPRILGFRTLLETSFIDKVGFQQREGRLRIVLSKDLRDSAGGLVRQVVDGILADHGLRREEVSHWILHPGGRKIIDAVQSGLGLTDAQVRHSTSVLRNFGNMSSPTVLFVLDRAVRSSSGDSRPKAGDLGVMVAMGPGLAVEGALLRW